MHWSDWTLDMHGSCAKRPSRHLAGRFIWAAPLVSTDLIRIRFRSRPVTFEETGGEKRWDENLR